jgi:hypothetical protein
VEVGCGCVKGGKGVCLVMREAGMRTCASRDEGDAYSVFLTCDAVGGGLLAYWYTRCKHIMNRNSAA